MRNCFLTLGVNVNELYGKVAINLKFGKTSELIRTESGLITTGDELIK